MENTKIEWCDSTYNPITGCYHGCEYCYANRIAIRFKGCDEEPSGETMARTVYLKEPMIRTRKDGTRIKAAYPYGFIPTFHEYRLTNPVKKHYGPTVFVGSTADIFGDWIPDEWIIKVFESCAAADDHRYLFLTKNPERYLRLAEKCLLPQKQNFWYGSTATRPDDLIFYSAHHNTFVSIEPILEPFSNGEKDSDVAEKVDWAIIGAETGNRSDKVVPKQDWIEELVEDFHDKEKPVFMKNSLISVWGEDLIREFPWNP